MMGHKDKLINGLEVDVVCARKWYCYIQNNSKIIRYVKRCIAKRNRAKIKQELKQL